MKKRVLGFGLALVWCAALVFGMGAAMRYDATPGRAGEPGSAIQPAKEAKWTCVMVAHPLCPCTRSSLKALREVAAVNGGSVAFRIVFAGERPAEASENMRLAEQVEGATVSWVSSDEAVERYGAFTSGQVFVYARDGRVAFSGGITPGRGVDQPIYARRLFAEVLEGRRSTSPVYGCPLSESSP